MKNRSKLILFSLFYFLCILNLSSGKHCSTVSCPQLVNNTAFNVPIEYPFYIKDVQPNSCAKPGFELYCDNTFGTTIKLPNYVVLQVFSILYYYHHIMLSDPFDNCLSQKLLSLNLTNTPFRPSGYTKNFWLYNCSGTDNYFYDKIDCLSGSNHTVISYDSAIYGSVISSNCRFIKTLTVPVPYSSLELSWVSLTVLTWSGEDSKKRYSAGLILGVLGGMVVGLCNLVWLCRFCKRRNAPATTTINTTTRNITPTNVVGGLDQVTIDAYPVLVIGESGRLIKPDDDSCTICLSEYRPHETLKILPDCLHRFHADCIDPWLLSKGACPLCRTSPPVNSSAH